MGPDLLEEKSDAAKATVVGEFAETDDALGELGAEGGEGGADGAGNEVDPDETAVEAVGARGDELEHVRQLGDEADAALLGRGEAGDEAAEVDAGGEAVGGSDVLGELAGTEDAVGIEGDGGRGGGELGEAELVAEGVDVLAQLNLVHAVVLESLEAGNLRDEVHDAVVAAHELAQAEGGIGRGQVLLAIGVGKGRRAALERGAENVDPGRQGHVEVLVGAMGLGGLAREIELLDEGDGGLKVLVPGNIGQGIVEAADGALKDNHAEGSLEDGLVVDVAIEGLAELGNGRVAMAHNIGIDMVRGEGGRGLVVLGGDAEAAVEVALVALQGGQDVVGARGAVLVRLEDGEDGGQDVRDKVVEQALVRLLELNGDGANVGGMTVGKVKERGVGVLGVGGPGGVEGEGDEGVGGGRGMVGAEGGDGGFAAERGAIDKHLALRLDVNLVLGEVGGGKVRQGGSGEVVEGDGGVSKVEEGELGVEGRGATVTLIGEGGEGVGEGGRRVWGGRDGGLFREFLALDDEFDIVLLAATLIIITPPEGTFVVAGEAEILAGGAEGRAFIALFAPETTGIAACEVSMRMDWR